MYFRESLTVRVCWHKTIFTTKVKWWSIWIFLLSDQTFRRLKWDQSDRKSPIWKKDSSFNITITVGRRMTFVFLFSSTRVRKTTTRLLVSLQFFYVYILRFLFQEVDVKESLWSWRVKNQSGVPDLLERSVEVVPFLYIKQIKRDLITIDYRT